MQLKFINLLVQNQEKALRFYTEVLGFTKMADIPMGGEYRWLTLTSPEGIEGVELVLQQITFPPAADYQQALYKAGIPMTAVISKDIRKDFDRLTRLGVSFRGQPQNAGLILTVLFDDTCGNWINLVQPLAGP